MESRRNISANEVLVGVKPTHVYILAALNALQSEKQIVLKARGKCISNAVFVAQSLKSSYGVSVGSVNIGSEELPRKDGSGGGNTQVASIEITLNQTLH